MRRAKAGSTTDLRLGRLAVTVVLAAVAAGAIGLAVVNGRRANASERDTKAAEQRIRDVATQRDTALSELRLAELALDASNHDREALQARIDGLAGTGGNGASQRQRAAELELASHANADARQCLVDVSNAMRTIGDSAATGANALVGRAQESCAASDASYASFSAAAPTVP